jgi:tetratricopeptide (TPR) repeat protein
LESALVVLAQALDVRYATQAFTQALHLGLLAMDEASDLAIHHAQGHLRVDVAMIVARHRSRVLSVKEAGDLTPIEAVGRYHRFAEEQLLVASGGSLVAAHALYGLGKVYGSMAQSGGPAERRFSQRPLLLYQVVLRIDGRHTLAATELGASLARVGRLLDAREILQQTVSNPTAESWQQLANVHAQLGEWELARQAEEERNRILPPRQGADSNTVTAPNGVTVKWVDRQTFERAGQDPGLARPQPSEPVPQTATAAGRASQPDRLQPQRSRNAW